MGASPSFCYGYYRFGCGTLFHFPGFAGEYELAQRLESFLGTHFSHLILHLLVLGESLHVADYADCERQVVSVHHSELLV